MGFLEWLHYGVLDVMSNLVYIVGNFLSTKGQCVLDCGGDRVVG
jgi:hypothetical protein